MHSKIIVLPDREAIARFANEYAPEHLIISMQEPWAMAEKIYAAGSIFIGNYSPESAGDYASGTNHTLPTSRWARSCSALGVESFMRRMTIQELSKEGLEGIGGAIETMALAEGLDAHAAAVKEGLENDVFMNISNLIRPSIKALDPYYTARDECGENRPEIFLDANESPYDNGINRYPDPRQKQLKAKIAAIKGISPNQLFLGNGSDEAIDLMAPLARKMLF